jgi:tetratricopeptide (TPR) repeat protein
MLFFDFDGRQAFRRSLGKRLCSAPGRNDPFLKLSTTESRKPREVSGMSGRAVAKTKRQRSQQVSRSHKPAGSGHEQRPAFDDKARKLAFNKAVTEADGSNLQPADLLQFQMSHGNAFVNHLMASHQMVQRAGGDKPQTSSAAPSEEISAYYRASALFNSGKYQEAFEAYQRFVQMPGTALIKGSAYLRMSKCQLALGNLDSAVRYAKQAGKYNLPTPNADILLLNEIKEKQGEGLFEQGVAKYQAGRYEEAMVLFEQARNNTFVAEHLQVKAVVNLGLCNKRLGRYATALRCFETYLGLPGAKATKGVYLANQMRRKLGLSPSKAGKAVMPEQRAKKLLRAANKLARRRKYRQAIISYERLVHQPGVGEAVTTPATINIGICNYRLGRYATANLYFQQYLKLPYARLKKGAYYLALTQGKLGLGPEAAAGKEKAAGVPSVDGKQAEAQFKKGVAKYKAGQHAVAIVLFEQARNNKLLAERLRVKAVFNLGLCSKRLRRYATAMRYFETYLGLPGAKVAKGAYQARQMRGKIGLPSTEFKQGKINERQATQLLGAANKLARGRKYRQAIIDYERLLHQPGVPEATSTPATINIGICNYRLGRYATANFYFQQYLKLPHARVKKGTYYLNRTRRKLGLPAVVAPKGAE